MNAQLPKTSWHGQENPAFYMSVSTVFKSTNQPSKRNASRTKILMLVEQLAWITDQLEMSSLQRAKVELRYTVEVLYLVNCTVVSFLLVI